MQKLVTQFFATFISYNLDKSNPINKIVKSS